MPKYALVEDVEQKVWLWIAGVFCLFYFGEAVLFWSPEPLVRIPQLRLVHWGVFAAVLAWVLRLGRRRYRRPETAAGDGGVPRALQSWALSLGITAAAVGLTYLVIAWTGNHALGHAVLAGTLFQAAIIIGGMSGSLGWLACGLTWAATAVAILAFPAWQDITLGAGVTAGFLLVGAIRRNVRSIVG